MNIRALIELIIRPLLGSDWEASRHMGKDILDNLVEQGYLVPYDKHPLTDYGRKYMSSSDNPLIVEITMKYSSVESTSKKYVIEEEPTKMGWEW